MIVKKSEIIFQGKHEYRLLNVRIIPPLTIEKNSTVILEHSPPKD